MAETLRNIVLTGQDRGASAAVHSVETALVRAQQAVDRYKATAVSTVVPLNNLQASATRSAAAATAVSRSYDLAGRRAGSMGGSMTQLSFQINDIASGLLIGQSPFQIMAQQGGQVFQIWQLNRNIFRELRDLIVSGAARAVTALGPLGLAGAGLAAVGAVAYYFGTVNDKAPSTESLLKTQADLTNAIKKAFSGAAESAAAFYDNSKLVYTALTRINALQLRAKLDEAVKSAVPFVPPSLDDVQRSTQRALPGLNLRPPPGFKFGASVYDPFRSAIEQFNKSVKAGEPDVKRYRDAIASVVNTTKDAETVKLGAKLLAESEEVNKLTTAIGQNDAQLKVWTGTATKADQARAGVTKTAGEGKNALDNLIRRTRDQIEEFKVEALTAGQTGQALDELKKKHELIRAAIKDGIPEEVALTRARLAGADAATYAAAKAGIRLAKLKEEMQFERDQLGRTPQEQEVQNRLRGAGIDPLSAIGAQTAEQLRFNASLVETRDLAKSALSTFVSDLQQGKDATEALTNALGRVQNKLLDMATDRLLSSLFGGAGSPLSLNASDYSGGGLSSIFSSIFGGARAGGGGVNAGRAYRVGERGEEYFIPGQSGTIVPNFAGGGAPRVSVQIVNNAGAEVSVGQPQRDSQGGVSLKVMIDKTVAQLNSTPGSDANRSLRKGFNLQPALTRF